MSPPEKLSVDSAGIDDDPVIPTIEESVLRTLSLSLAATYRLHRTSRYQASVEQPVTSGFYLVVYRPDNNPMGVVVGFAYYSVAAKGWSRIYQDYAAVQDAAQLPRVPLAPKGHYILSDLYWTAFSKEPISS